MNEYTIVIKNILCCITDETVNKKSVIGIKNETQGTNIMFVINEAGITTQKYDKRIRKPQKRSIINNNYLNYPRSSRII